ncbi:MAG: 50S ribosomal protein L30 [Deltaproteobacteria bacterium]|nr:50S ribosomal protein L30 [Deltaproteobacteria bacterium]
MTGTKMIKVKMVKSPIGSPKKMRENLKGLGLSHLNSIRELQDSPSVRGMIAKVSHLVKVV